MISVVYEKRALPLAWLVYKGKQGHTTAQRPIEALEKVLPLIPAQATATLLGDAAYDTSAMLHWLAEHTAVTVNLLGWWGLRYEQPIYLITSLPARYQACQYYRHRFRIETFFSDQKSHGFHIHKSHLADPARLGRLLLAACLTYLWVIAQGLLVIAEQRTGRVDRTDRQDKSLFRLGLDWIHYALKRNLDFEPTFHLQFRESLALMYSREIGINSMILHTPELCYNEGNQTRKCKSLSPIER